MKPPSQKECFQLIHDMKMMDHIIDHSIMVGNVAVCLGTHLKRRFPAINMELLISAALLHDITKTRSFKTGELHSKTGGRLLDQMGYPQVGNIIRQHVLLDAGWEKHPITEIQIVNYSDKRVLHDKVVPLYKRFKYIKKRYGGEKKFQKRIQKLCDASCLLEKNLFATLPFKAEDLIDHTYPVIQKQIL